MRNVLSNCKQFPVCFVLQLSFVSHQSVWRKTNKKNDDYLRCASVTHTRTHTHTRATRCEMSFLRFYRSRNLWFLFHLFPVAAICLSHVLTADQPSDVIHVHKCAVTSRGSNNCTITLMANGMECNKNCSSLILLYFSSLLFSSLVVDLRTQTV